MSQIPTDSGIPRRLPQPQTQVMDTFVGFRAPGPQLQQPAELPRWQSELFEVAEAFSGLSNSLSSLSKTWGAEAERTGKIAGDEAFTLMNPEQQRNAAAKDWAELERDNPSLKGSSPFMRLAIRQAAGKRLVEQQLGKVLNDNMDRLADPMSDEDAMTFSAGQLRSIIEKIPSVYARDAANQYGTSMIEKYNGVVEDTKRKRTVLKNNENFQMEVKDILEENLSAEGDMTADGLAERFKVVQDKYHTITGDSGNLAVFDAVKGMAETLIANGRYGDARELVRGMSSYSSNGQVTFGKMYAEEFSKLIDLANDKEQADVRSVRQDDAYRIGKAATSALFNVDASKMQSMTEGELKALAQQTVQEAGLDPSYFGEMYDTILQVRDGQLDRLNRGKDADAEDLSVMMRIRRETMSPDADYDSLEQQVYDAHKSGVIKRDTAMALLGQIENSKNVYSDSASPAIREARGRLKFGTGINPSDLKGSALVEYDQIVTGLEMQFDQAVVAAREEVLKDMTAKGIPVNSESVNHHLGMRSNEIATDLMQKANERISAFRAKYEPKALFREYMTSSSVPQTAAESLNDTLNAMSGGADMDPGFKSAVERSRLKYNLHFRKFINAKVVELSQQGLEGQELYDAVDAAVVEETEKKIGWLNDLNERRMDPSKGVVSVEKGYGSYPGIDIARAARKDMAARTQLPAVPEEFAGLTQAGRFGNTFRSWIEELNTEDEADLAEARTNAKAEAGRFVQQVGAPRSNNITVSGASIMRDGVIDNDATSTYWNAKVQWDGLSIAEVRTGRTDEGLQIDPKYLLSRVTKIKELDTPSKLRAAYGQYVQSQSGPFAEYLDALPFDISPVDAVDLLRYNLETNLGETENP